MRKLSKAFDRALAVVLDALTLLIPFIVIFGVVGGSLFVAWRADVQADGIMRELQMELKDCEFAFIYWRFVKASITVSMENRSDFLEKVELYQPRVIYYDKGLTMTYVSFSFYEDEASKQILYKWFCRIWW